MFRAFRTPDTRNNTLIRDATLSQARTALHANTPTTLVSIHATLIENREKHTLRMTLDKNKKPRYTYRGRRGSTLAHVLQECDPTTSVFSYNETYRDRFHFAYVIRLSTPSPISSIL